MALANGPPDLADLSNIGARCHHLQCVFTTLRLYAPSSIQPSIQARALELEQAGLVRSRGINWPARKHGLLLKEPLARCTGTAIRDGNPFHCTKEDPQDLPLEVTSMYRILAWTDSSRLGSHAQWRLHYIVCCKGVMLLLMAKRLRRRQEYLYQSHLRGQEVKSEDEHKNALLRD